MATKPIQRLLPNQRILRYTYKERIMHWVAGLSYIYLLLTGLAFYTPHLYWIALVLGGGSISRLWHAIIGLVFSAAVVWMYVDWGSDMKTTEVDLAWRKTIRQYIRNEDELVAPACRFNSGQKSFFWIMFWGGLALLLSGVALWFTEYIPWSLRFLRYVAVLVHVIAALFTIGAFIIHVYMGAAVVREGFSSVIRGEVSEQWAKTHHPLWLRQVQRDSRADN
ncbi:MAG: formate dehydrogenase subunit gamma [Terriglobales bacterium]